MASPASQTSESNANQSREQITFRFCSECSNMLYPKEDEETRTLQFTCRTCQYSETAQSLCVFRNDINTAVGETAGVTQDVGSDPTVRGSLGPTTTPCRPSFPTAPACSAQLLPVLCVLCSAAIFCVVCARPDPTLGTVHFDPAHLDALQPLGQLSPRTFFPCDGSGHVFSDPFSEYDEELEPDDDDDGDNIYDDDSGTPYHSCYPPLSMTVPVT